MHNDTTLCAGDYIIVNSPNTDNFRWSDGTVGNILYHKYSGIYTVTASNYYYSVDSTVRIELFDCNNDIFIPNTFTPNSDNLNEVFQPVFTRIEQLETFQFYIYNRWGNLVYYTADATDGWTGDECQSGVYGYIIKYKNRKEKEKEIRGKVVLLR